MELRKFTRLSMLLALSVVLNIIESFLPIFNGMIPGFKLGLANIIILLTLYIYGFKDAIYLSVSRVFLVGILRTGVFSITFLFSLSGAIFSLLVMTLVKKTNFFSLIGVSIIGSLCHSVGQILVAILFTGNGAIYYLPYIMLLSVPTGILTGLISKELVNQFKNIL